MSLILTAGAAMGAFYLTGSKVDENNKKLREEQAAGEPPKTVAKTPLYTGRYGDISSYNDQIITRDMIKSVTMDRDLSGVPCRWIELGNGAVYKTYDMEYP